MDYLIFAPPRCRTAWLANFLTYENSYCYHEALSMCERVSDMKDMRREGITGNSDSGMFLFPEKVLKEFPNAKVVLIKRPIGEVEKSLNRVFTGTPQECEFTARMSQRASDWMETNVKGMLVASFSDLEKEQVCKNIWDFCNQYRSFDKQRWKMLANFNVQLNEIKFDKQQITNLLNNEGGIQ